MIRKKYFIASISFVFLLIFLIFFIHSTTAADNVETDIELHFVDGTHLEVDVVLNVHSITLPANDVTYTKSEIQSLSVNNPEMMGAIKISVKGLTFDQLKDSFPGCRITSLQELPTYSSGLFYDSYVLSLSPGFFSLNESIDLDTLINGYLDCGAYINYTFSLKSYAGWNQSFTFSLPPSIGYKRTNGNVQQNKITWMVKTTSMPEEEMAQLTLLESVPTTDYTENESLYLQYILTFTESAQPVLTLQFKGHSIDISLYKMMPSFISHVKTLPADGLRLSVQQNLTSWDTIKKITFDPAMLQVKPIIENSSFNQTLLLAFSWDNETTDQAIHPFNTSNMDINPPITANYQDPATSLTICNTSSRGFFGLINAGATSDITQKDINIGDNLDSTPYPYNGTIFFPDFVQLNDESVYHWDAHTPIEGSFSSLISPEYTKDNITSHYEISVKSTDLNLLSFFTGKTEVNMGLHLNEHQKINVTTLPFQFTLPDKILLTYLNSDAFRLCVEENVFSQEQLEQYTTYQKNLFKSRSQSLFPLIKGSATFDQSLFDSSLLWDQNITTMEGKNPILLSSSMQSSFPISFDFSILPPQVIIQPLNLSFSGIQHQDVTYSMSFPKGITIDITDSLDRAKIKQNPDGTQYFTVSFDETEGGKIDTVLVHMYPSGLYIIGIFIPCILSVFITIILLILVFIIRKKRKTLPPVHKDIPPQDYDQEEYYIPPPPPSKRK